MIKVGGVYTVFESKLIPIEDIVLVTEVTPGRVTFEYPDGEFTVPYHEFEMNSRFEYDSETSER